MATATEKEGRPVHGAISTAREEPPVHRGTVATWLSKLFEFNSAGLNWFRGVLILDVLLVPLVLFWSIGHEQYLLSAIFGVVFAAVADPGGRYGSRAWRLAVFGLVGAGLTALGYAMRAEPWGWLALAAFGVTLVAGLVIRLGVHAFVAGFLLNIWFVIAQATAVGFHQHPHPITHITNYTWAEVAAWAGGTALWIAVTFVAWLIRGRRDDEPPLVPEVPGDSTPHPLTRPAIMFVVLRAVVLAGTVALAYGLSLSYGHWMSIAAIIAMKPSLGQSTLVAVQRLVGAALGAGVAALLLLIPANEHGLTLLSITHGLDIVAIVLFMHAAAIRFWSFTFFTAAIAAAVLILVDLLQPTNYGAEGYRILWTLYGVGVGVIVMFLAGLLAKRKSRTRQQPAAERA
jgi:uncharacterized membrane protein YccC